MVWEEIIAFLLKGWLSSRAPKRKLANALVQLYLSMLSCHESYLVYRGDMSDEKLRLWRMSISDLFRAIDRLDPLIDIYDTKLKQLLHGYVYEESVSALFLMNDDPSDLLKEQKKSQETADFDLALERLRMFIRENITMEDIFGK